MNTKTRPIFQLEDFHPFATELRQLALQSKFIDWLGPDGHLYRRVCIMEIPGIRAMLEGCFGPIEMLGMAFRLNYNDEEPNCAIHSDLGWGTHALVLYLSEGPGGTAFWKHKKTGTDRIDVGDVWLFEQVNKDWNDENCWELEHLVPMKFNRAIIYESALFHSRYPFKAFGDSPSTGRLIVTAFFNIQGKL